MTHCTAGASKNKRPASASGEAATLRLERVGPAAPWFPLPALFRSRRTGRSLSLENRVARVLAASDQSSVLCANAIPHDHVIDNLAADDTAPSAGAARSAVAGRNEEVDRTHETMAPTTIHRMEIPDAMSVRLCGDGFTAPHDDRARNRFPRSWSSVMQPEQPLWRGAICGCRWIHQSTENDDQSPSAIAHVARDMEMAEPRGKAVKPVGAERFKRPRTFADARSRSLPRGRCRRARRPREAGWATR